MSPIRTVQTDNINNQIVAETSIQGAIREENENITISNSKNKEKNYFQFLEDQRLTDESDIYLNSSQGSEKQQTIEHELFDKSLLDKEDFLQDKDNVIY